MRLTLDGKALEKDGKNKMSVLIIDVESTSLNVNQARIIELGAMITPLDFSYSLGTMNSLVKDSTYPALTQETIDVTRITQQMLNEEARTPGQAVELLKTIIDPKELLFVCAFNVEYDKPVFIEDMKRSGLTMDPVINHIIQLPWVCGLRDVASHQKFKSRKLSHLALEYGVPVDPAQLHRALGDVELTRKMLHAVPTSADVMYEYQKIPWVVLKAHVAFDQKDLAKAAGFSWQKVHGDEREYTRAWVKRIKTTEVEKESNYEFRVSQI